MFRAGGFAKLQFAGGAAKMAAVAFTPSDTEQQLRKNLAQSIDLVVMTNIEDLVQSSNLGSQSSFEPLRPVFQKTMALFQLLSAANLDCVTETQLKRLANAAARMRNEFDQLKGFAPNQYPHRQSKIDSMIARYEEVFLEIAPVMCVSQHARLEDDVSQVRDLTRALEEKHRQFDSYKAETEKQLADILSKAKEITEKLGIL